jgi:hypothetical protein
MKNLLLPFLLLAFSCSGPSIKSTEVCDTLLIQTINNRFLNDSLKDAIQINSLHQQIDTLKAITYILNKTISRHDSLINERQFKRDRAERRGLFAGNLIKAFVK